MQRQTNKQLKDYVYSGPSEIHGTGLFAKIEFEQGQYIGTYFGPNAKRDGTYVLWVYEDSGIIVGRSGRNMLRFLNHQERGNAEFDGFDLYASKTINPNEEITFNYAGDE